MAVTTRRINHDANVEKYRLAADTDAQAIQRTVNMAKSAGGKKRIILPVNYSLSTQIDVAGLNGMTIEGAGPDQSSHTGLGAIGQYLRTTGAVQDLTIRGLGFDGSGVDDATGPRRSRTWSANMSTAMILRGDLDPIARLTADASAGATSVTVGGWISPGPYNLGAEPVTISSLSGASAPFTATLAAPLAGPHTTGQAFTVRYAVRNVRVEHCALRNVLYAASGSAGLPVLLAGIRGEIEFNDIHAYNTMDCGFVNNEHVKITNFRGEKSADNGISISRGNQRVTARGLTVIDSAYHGVWLSGYNGKPGPQNFVLSGVNVINPGKSGIWADDAPKHGVITDFYIDLKYNRGPTDAQDDADGIGVFLGGSGDRAAPTALTENVHIGSGVIRNAARAGVVVYTAKGVRISDVMAVDTGVQYALDGATPISSSDTSRNVGFILGNSATSESVFISDTTTIDTRSPAYCNIPISPVQSGRFIVGPGNTSTGCRYSNNITESGTASDVRLTSVSQRFLGGAVAGSSAATGTVAGFDSNGAAGSTRLWQWLTNSVARWKIGADPTAEAGSNVGTDFVVNAFDDGGTPIATLLRMTRLGAINLGRNGYPITLLGRVVSGSASASINPGAQASTASAAGNGANAIAGTVNVTASASASAGVLAQVTFATAFAQAPHVVITPVNAASQACGPYLSSRGASSFVISCAAAPAASASLQFDYLVIG